MSNPSAIPAPLVSIVTPIYERPDLVAPLLDMLDRQTLQDWELVLVDDCSSADIAGALAAARPLPDPRHRLMRLTRNGGPSAARNAGIAAARGRFVAFLDSDDAWDPEKLARQTAALMALAVPDTGFCTCGTSVSYPGGQSAVKPERSPADGERPATFLFVHNQFAQCSSFCCGAALLSGPGGLRFDESLRQYEDHLFYLAAATRASAAVHLPEPLSFWRNDDRGDRMGARDDMARGESFLATARAGGLLTETEALAFEVRCLGREILSRSRMRGMGLGLRALAERALPREAGLKLLLSGVIGPATYARLRETRR